MAAHPQRGRAAVGHGHDGFGPQVVGGEQRPQGNGLVDAGQVPWGKVAVCANVFGGLGGGADVGHFAHGFQRVFAHRRFGAEHDGIGAIEHGIGHVADLGAGGQGVGDHAFHHLRGGDDQFVHLPRHANHFFLQCGHGGVAHFHRQIAPGDHDAVAHAQDVFQVRDGFGAFHFGNQAGAVAGAGGGHGTQLAGHFHIGGVFGEAHRHIVCAQLYGGFDVFHVLGGQRRGRQAAALFVDAFVVGQLTAHHHFGVYRLAQHPLHAQHDQAIVEQQHIARAHIARQLFVIQPHAALVTQGAAGRIEGKAGPFLQLHLALGKLAHADFGPLQVGHDGHLAPGAARGFAHDLGPGKMVLGAAMAKVEAHHVHPC